MSAASGRGKRIAHGVIRVTAPNPGPMTGPGTNSYVVGNGPCAIIDPGVDDAAHLGALEACAPGPVAAILITHAHPDHTGGARALAAATGAPVRAYPAPLPGERDDAFGVDAPLHDGDAIALGDTTLVALHTPGHSADHLCFYARESRLLFAGDTVMADVTVVILPPDGRMSDYLASLERLRGIDLDAIAPGHGRLLEDPPRVLEQIVAHRLEREAQVRDALSGDTRTPGAIAAALYPDLDPRLRNMAAAQVEAHLIRLAELGQARREAAGWRGVTN